MALPPPLPVLVSPDSFKGTLSAAEVAEAIGRGLAAEDLAIADLCPVADGGEGTLQILLAALGGRPVTATVADPLGRPVRARFGLLGDGRTAVVEVAEASGLHRVGDDERDPIAASTRGTGELIAAAARAGAATILVAAGGSATSDGGAGALSAIDDAGGLGGADLVVLSDVETPFELAAERFGPQKGADAEAVAVLTARLHVLAASFPRDPRGVPRAGAAGGLSGALWAVHGARLERGAGSVLDTLGFDARLAAARAVVVGEGRLDRTTLEGKIAGEIARRAAGAGVPCHAIVGSRALDDDEAAALGLASVIVASTPAQLQDAGTVLARRVASEVAAAG
jgi:glycerate kinase